MARKKKRMHRRRGFGSLAGKRCPRKGTRVVVKLHPVSKMLYGRGGPPRNGAHGEVTTVPGMARFGTCLGGPGGGLVFVKFDGGGTMGVSPHDLDREKKR